MTVSTWLSEAEPTTRLTHDVVVVGAGLIGSYCAGLLTRARKDVAIVDSHYPAAGASGGNAGFVHIGIHLLYADACERLGRDVARELWGLTVENVRRVDEMAGRLGVERDRKGVIFVSQNETEVASMRDSAALAQQDGFGVEFVDGDPTGLGFEGAMLQPDDYTVQPATLTIGLANASGATIYANDEVVSISQRSGGLLVHTRTREIECEKVLLAVNAYAARVDPFFRGLVRPYRAEVTMTGPVPKIFDTVFRIRGSFYFQQLKDSRLLVGGGSDKHKDLCATWSDETTPEVQRSIEGLVKRYLPDLEFKPVRRWASIMGLTPDYLPIIGALPDKPDVFYAVGFSGHGLSLGFVAGERAVELMFKGTPTGIFDVARVA